MNTCRETQPKRYALVTSIRSFFFFQAEDGIRDSHIVDPHTGVGLTDHSLVTVIARDGITADGLSTAVSVLGPKEGVRLVEQTRAAAVHIVRMPGDKIGRASCRERV